MYVVCTEKFVMRERYSSKSEVRDECRAEASSGSKVRDISGMRWRLNPPFLHGGFSHPRHRTQQRPCPGRGRDPVDLTGNPRFSLDSRGRHRAARTTSYGFAFGSGIHRKLADLEAAVVIHETAATLKDIRSGSMTRPERIRLLSLQTPRTVVGEANVERRGHTRLFLVALERSKLWGSGDRHMVPHRHCGVISPSRGSSVLPIPVCC